MEKKEEGMIKYFLLKTHMIYIVRRVLARLDHIHIFNVTMENTQI